MSTTSLRPPWYDSFRAEISRRTKAAMAEKQRRGEYCGGHVPYGYALGNRDFQGVRLVPDPTEQAVISKVKELRADGVTYHTIATVLAVDGFRARSGKPFALWQLFRIARQSLVTL